MNRAAAHLQLTVDQQTFSSPLLAFPNGETDAYRTLAGIANDALAQGIQLRACANCLHFRMSGMSGQMSGGFAGYCMLVGPRSSNGVVTIDFACGEQVDAPGWPGNLEQVRGARDEFLAHNKPARRGNAYRGCLLALSPAADELRSLVALLGQSGGSGFEFQHRSSALASVCFGLYWWRREIQFFAATIWSDFTALAALISLAMKKRDARQMRDAFVRTGLPNVAVFLGQLDAAGHIEPADDAWQTDALVAALIHCFWREPFELDASIAVARAARVPAAGELILRAMHGAFNGARWLEERQITMAACEIIELADALERATPSEGI